MATSSTSTWRDEGFMKLLESKVLVIGAGGIGCELLKNLALTGLKNISVIDLDTIDISNLNRQFRKEHVGKSKAEVASEAVNAMCPGVNIEHYHDSVMSDKFGVDFFKGYSLVLSALDNRAARSHVNRMCLVADVPLVESGSAGYLGQVGAILKGRTECYDCTEKAKQKTYPNCTIRNTPSELIHCVVWAKSLFNQLFGEVDPDDDVSPEMDEESGAVDTAKNGAGGGEKPESTTNGNGEASKGEKKKENTRMFAEKHDYDAGRLFNKLFNDDILYLLSMANLWKERKRPTPVNYDGLIAEGEGAGPSRKLTPNDNWSLEKWTGVYTDAVQCLHERYKQNKMDGDGVLAWDKDDEPGMEFVAACANIRAHIFDIPMKSMFEIKSMAGNIIPAIATTNAMVAGMLVVEALKILRGQLDKCRMVFIARAPNPRGKVLVDEVPSKPNPNCYVCSTKGEVNLELNMEKMPLKTFRDAILLDALGMRAPDVTDIFTHRQLISSEEGETDALMDRTLQQLGVKSGAQLEVDDFVQELKFKILVFHGPELDVQQFEIKKHE